MEEIQKLNISNLDINLLIDKAINYGIKIAAGLLIVVIGFWLAARVSKVHQKETEHTIIILIAPKIHR